MAKTDRLGELEYIDPKGYFRDEAKVFTPWVASGGLGRLSKALKTELELVKTEQSVGNLKADIVCTDPDDETVLIENQLTPSDNKHLGQLIAYAAGTGATTVVWVAPRFKPEHRVAVGLLNRVDGPKVRFFCVEIRLWQIEDSALAPQFVVVAHPDDWESGRIAPPVDPDKGKFYEDYWTSLKDHLEGTGCTVTLQNPSPKSLIFAPLGKAGCTLKSSISVLKNQTKVDLIVTGQDAEAFGQLLHLQKGDIEKDLGDAAELDWKIPPDWSITTISTASVGWNLEDRNQWRVQFDWFAKHLNDFERVFGARVRAIDPADYTPEESDDDQGDSAEARTDDDV